MKTSLKEYYRAFEINLKYHHLEAYTSARNAPRPYWKICCKNVPCTVTLWSQYMLPWLIKLLSFNPKKHINFSQLSYLTSQWSCFSKRFCRISSHLFLSVLCIRFIFVSLDHYVVWLQGCNLMLSRQAIWHWTNTGSGAEGSRTLDQLVLITLIFTQWLFWMSSRTNSCIIK